MKIPVDVMAEFIRIWFDKQPKDACKRVADWAFEEAAKKADQEQTHEGECSGCCADAASNIGAAIRKLKEGE